MISYKCPKCSTIYDEFHARMFGWECQECEIGLVDTHVLKIYTARINYDGADRLDTTVKSASGPIGKLFAPTWDIVMAHKRGEITDGIYTTQYRNLLSTRFNGSQNNQELLRRFFERDSVTLLCYCPAGSFCHRRLLADDILPRVAKHMGYEIEHKGEK